MIFKNIKLRNKFGIRKKEMGDILEIKYILVVKSITPLPQSFYPSFSIGANSGNKEPDKGQSSVCG